MVLATPTALVASVGNAALRGNLIKKGATIESMARIDTVIFDKTGTLTHGEPKLASVIALNNNKDKDLLLLAAVAEKFSEHPLGKAVVKAAEEKGLLIPDPESFESISGTGIRVKTNGKDIFIGRLKQASEFNLLISHDPQDSPNNFSRVYILIELKLCVHPSRKLFFFEFLGLIPESPAVIIYSFNYKGQL